MPRVASGPASGVQSGKHSNPPMPDLQPLRQRARSAEPDELGAIPWWPLLGRDLQGLVGSHIHIAQAEPGERICRVGKAATYWFGVVDGLLKMSNDELAGAPPITFAGLPPGGWFGEGTLLKREPYRYNVQALRRSIVAGLPLEQFDLLLGHSIAFNRYVLNQLNERLGQFIAARETDRSHDPDQRVARNLAALFHPQLYPGVGTLLRITQQELAYLVGLSRQRVNVALQHLQQTGCIRIEYGGVRVLDLERLQQHRGERPP